MCVHSSFSHSCSSDSSSLTQLSEKIKKYKCVCVNILHCLGLLHSSNGCFFYLLSVSFSKRSKFSHENYIIKTQQNVINYIRYTECARMHIIVFKMCTMTSPAPQHKNITSICWLHFLVFFAHPFHLRKSQTALNSNESERKTRREDEMCKERQRAKNVTSKLKRKQNAIGDTNKTHSLRDDIVTRDFL